MLLFIIVFLIRLYRFSNVENAQESTHLLAQTSLRNVLGTRLLSELLCDRGAVSNMMRECLDEATDNWGN